ncbi:MAG: DUF4158 domain-containing protein [Phyllobacterium sp.]
MLTNAERHELLILPVDDDTLILYRTLGEVAHRLLDTRRQTDTRPGMSLQFCAPRYPGHLILRSEMIPEVALGVLAAQLGIEPDALSALARRAPTRYMQQVVLRQYSAEIIFSGPDDYRCWLLPAPPCRSGHRAHADFASAANDGFVTLGETTLGIWGNAQIKPLSQTGSTWGLSLSRIRIRNSNRVLYEN